VLAASIIREIALMNPDVFMNIPEDSHHHTRRRDNLKPHIAA
jgi:hypothetical protein